MARLYGRAPRGQRVREKLPHGHWKTFTVLAAVRLEGTFAPAVFDGPIDRLSFVAYVEQMLTRSLRPGDVVIMDNLAAHKAAAVSAAIEAVGARVLYLPPYSPDFNPIECLWSKVKTYLRKIGARDFESLCDAVAGALASVSVADCQGFFKNCGYDTSWRNAL